MARPRARALSVTVRVHRGGVDGLILVEVEVLGAALDEYRHDGLFNSWKTPLSVRPLLRCADLSATVQKIVQAPVPDSHRLSRFPSGVPARALWARQNRGANSRGCSDMHSIRAVFVPSEWPRKNMPKIIGRLRFIIGLLRAARDHPILSESIRASNYHLPTD